jgi:hypothetical protein
MQNTRQLENRWKKMTHKLISKLILISISIFMIEFISFNNKMEEEISFVKGKKNKSFKKIIQMNNQLYKIILRNRLIPMIM